MRIALCGSMMVALAACSGGKDAANAPADDSRAADAPRADTLSLAERRAAGGRIIFLSERGGAAQVYAVTAAGDERRLPAGTGAVFPAAVSGDGKTVIGVSVREEGDDHGEQLVVLPADDGAAKPIGPASSRERSPSLSPDGRWMVFESDRESFRDLYRINTDGTGLKRLTENREGNFDPAVSPDGRWIAFASSRDGDAEVYVMRADGGGQRRLTAFYRDDLAPRWSPDGRTIAFVSNREGADRIFLVSPDGTGLRKLNPPDTARSVQEADAAWSPDGTRIAHTLHVRQGESRIRIVDVRGGAAKEIAGVQGASQPAWSPDGRYLVFAAGAGDETDLWIARADGTAPTRITRAKGADWLPRWTR